MKKLTLDDFHSYQKRAFNHTVDHPMSMLWLDMGLGKTSITLASIVERLERFEVNGVLILAPLRVCQTVWEQEAKKWEFAGGLKFSRVFGNEITRIRGILNKNADIYLMNYENIAWLIDYLSEHVIGKGNYPPFNMIVFDEVTKMKDSTTERHRELRKILPYIPYRIGLTGTPASNGYKDLFGQYLAVDNGHRLGTSIHQFRSKYFHKSGYGGYTYEINEGASEKIKESIADITLQMTAEDYLELPETIINDVNVILPPKARKAYNELEKELFTELDNGDAVEVFNAAALTNKCLQAANGAVYLEPGNPKWSRVHDAKLDTLEDIIEESGRSPILCLHSFRSDAERILKRFKFAEQIKGGMSTKKIEDMVDRWNNGEIQLLIGHPASMGHGLNLQYGGNTVVWYGLNWSLDLYEQAIARIARQGQTKTVIVHRLLAGNTTDEAVAIALESKSHTQKDLRKAIDQYRAKRGL